MKNLGNISVSEDVVTKDYVDKLLSAIRLEILGSVSSRTLTYYSGSNASITVSSPVVGIFAYHGSENIEVDYSVFDGLVTVDWTGVTASSSCPVIIKVLTQPSSSELIGGDDAWQYGDVIPNFSGSFGSAEGYMTAENGDVLTDNNNNIIGF